MKLHKFKIFCETDNKWEKIIKQDGEDAPTTCPVDTSHTVTLDSEVIEDVIDTEAQKDSEGAYIQRTKICPTGWHYQLHSIEFSTSKLEVDYSKGVSGGDIGFSEMRCWDGDDNEILDDQGVSGAVKTSFRWEPTHDYGVVGAKFYQSESPSENIRMWTIGVPRIPYEYGGNRLFVEGGINLKFISTGTSLQVDGRAPKQLQYDPIYHTGEFELVFKHPMGHIHEMMMVFEIFKE